MTTNINNKIKIILRNLPLWLYRRLKETISEKVELVRNPRKFAHEFRELAKREGVPFMVYAIVIEILEDVGLPIVLTIVGKPQFIPIVWAWHSEPVLYPLWFGVRKTIRVIRKNRINLSVRHYSPG